MSLNVLNIKTQAIKKLLRYESPEVKRFKLLGDYSYFLALKQIIERGVLSEDRTNTGTYRVLGLQYRHDLETSFPVLSMKRIHKRSVDEELLWFLRGQTQVGPLKSAGVSIWDEWATEEQCNKLGRVAGDLGPVYGHQWRNYGATLGPRDALGNTTWNNDGVDQIQTIIDQITNNPSSRRIILNAWNPAEANSVTLPPCHTMAQFLVINNRLHCHLLCRSTDYFLGMPFNIATYATLTHLLSSYTNLEVGELVVTSVDAHVYANHMDAVDKYLTRILETLSPHHKNCTPVPKPVKFVISDRPAIDFGIRDSLPESSIFKSEWQDYEPLGPIAAPVAV